ncbi:hypothetical protein [Maribacter sp. 2-571]|uniref:hypothetical protein n=1 Tax=Maribacter sp. 2-571 TaxID=3417569 RepID=UPI003D328DF5
MEMEIVPHKPLQKKGFTPTVILCEIVSEINHKMKSGVQSELLPVTALFPRPRASDRSNAIIRSGILTEPSLIVGRPFENGTGTGSTFLV